MTQHLALDVPLMVGEDAVERSQDAGGVGVQVRKPMGARLGVEGRRPRILHAAVADWSQMPACNDWFFSVSRRVSAIISDRELHDTARVRVRRAQDRDTETRRPRRSDLAGVYAKRADGHQVGRLLEDVAPVTWVLDRMPRRSTLCGASASAGVTEMTPGTQNSIQDVAPDAEAARRELLECGVDAPGVAKLA